MAKKKKPTRYERFIPAILVAWVVLMGIVIFTRPVTDSEATEPTKQTPTPTTAYEAYTSFTSEGFSFQVPESLQVQYSNPDTTVWKARFDEKSFTYNSLVLRRQLEPFPALEVGSKLDLATGTTEPTPVSVTIQTVDEAKEIAIDGIPATRYTVTCGIDCYYHLIRFERNNYFYELRSDGAGGGLLQNDLSTI